MENWYNDLEGLTPKTWFNWSNLPETPHGYVLKGQTNSRKFEWDKKMFAKDKVDFWIVLSNLLGDSFISDQGVCVREYIPLKTYDVGINGMRFTKEYRCFYYKDKLLDFGYYWSVYDGERKDDYLNSKAFGLLSKVSEIVSKHINFYAVDIAETESGEWIVIELNDGQMSGLSTIDPTNFYKTIKKEIMQGGIAYK